VDLGAPGVDIFSSVADSDSSYAYYSGTSMAAPHVSGVAALLFADDDTLEEMGIASPYELTGLYSGIPLTEKSVADQGYGPDTVYLYRRAILEEWIERGDVGLEHLVGHVLIHEIAHHFGWSDAQLHAIEDWTL
jgi:predicted Zn-dependent protease with MMP-like domain